MKDKKNAKDKNRISPFAVIISILMPVVAAVWLFQFTGGGYRMTVPLRGDFEEIAENVYINQNFSGNKEDVAALVGSARERDAAFFGDLQCTDRTVVIVCDDGELLKKLGGDHDTQSVVFPFRKSYICVSDEYLDVDILAHEITHAELHGRLKEKALKRIPTWFDEGIATQNDCREKYSPAIWAEQTDNGKNTIALADMDEREEFYAGTEEDRHFRYLIAKHEVSEWMETHGREGLLALIDRMNNGEEFAAAYGE